MKCPGCGHASLARDTRDLPYTLNGQSIVIANVTGDFCAACGEVVLDEDESAHISPALLDFNRQAVKVEVNT